MSKKKNMKKFQQVAKAFLQNPCMSCGISQGCSRPHRNLPYLDGHTCPHWKELPIELHLQKIMEQAFPGHNWSHLLGDFDLVMEKATAFSCTEELLKKVV